MASVNKFIGIRIDIIWIVASQIVSLATSFMLLYMLTHTLSVNSYGLYTLWFGIAIFVRQVLYDPLSYVLVKECSALLGSQTQLSKELSAIRATFQNLTVLLISIAVLLAVIFFVADALKDINVLIVSGVIFVALNATQGIFLALLNITSNRKAFGLFTMFDAFAKLALATLVLLLFERTLFNYLFALCLATLISCTAINVYLRKKSFTVNPEQFHLVSFLKRKLLTALPLFLPTTLVAFKGVLDKWMLAAYIGVADLAVYNVLLQIGYSTMLISFGMIQTYVAPRIYQLCSSDSNNSFKEVRKFLIKLFLILSSFSFIAIFLALIFGNYLFLHFMPPAYREFAYLLPWFVAAGGLTAAANILYLVVIGTFDSTKAATITNISVVFSVIVIFSAVSFMGFVGSIFGLILSSAITLITYVIFVGKDFAVKDRNSF